MLSEEIIMKFYEEVSRIRELLEILARSHLKEELEKVATTDKRKKIWTLCNGFLNTREIAERVKVSQRAVQIFMSKLQEADLITVERRGYPKRKFDYVPSSWAVKKE